MTPEQMMDYTKAVARRAWINDLMMCMVEEDYATDIVDKKIEKYEAELKANNRGSNEWVTREADAFAILIAAEKVKEDGLGF